jgi:DNA-directed RNA polymerase specialized sigma24 family protein
LEYIGDLSVSFTAEVETKVWFEQISLSLNERDRAILVLLTRDASTVEIATFLNTSYSAAAKAMQRVKDRISAIVNGKRPRPVPGLDTGDLA